jgi:integrase
MPKIKTKRNDILRKKEILAMLKIADPWLAAAIAIAWIFGKRVNEILRLDVDSIRIDDKFLYIRFFVSKKKIRTDVPVPRPYLKRISLTHLGVPYILRYVQTVKEGLLFPDMSRQLALYYLKKTNPKAWFHLFRESLATEMAEHGASEEMLMHWFDWDRIDTAHQYVKRGTKLTEELSERTW